MYMVVIHSEFLHSAEATVGPFNTRAEAIAWRDERDYLLREDEHMFVLSVSHPATILQIRRRA